MISIGTVWYYQYIENISVTSSYHHTVDAKLAPSIDLIATLNVSVNCHYAVLLSNVILSAVILSVVRGAIC
jgi:hypothetical protein